MTWDFEQTRWHTEGDQEWICVPWDPNADSIPTQLRGIADQWEAANREENGS